MKISVIIPVYNVEIYLEQCVKSVLNQSYENIEVIAINDGSTDKSAEILDLLSKEDNRLHVIHKENGGYGSAINAGLDFASGEYISIVESDDWVDEEMLSILAEPAVKFGHSVVKGTFNKVTSDGTITKCEASHIVQNNSGLVEPSESLELMIFESSIWSAIYSLSFLRANNIRMLETEGASYQDVVWKFMVYSSIPALYMINKPIYNYRVFALGSSSSSTQKAEAMFYNYSVIKKYLVDNHKFEAYKESYYVHQMFDCVFHSSRLNGAGLNLFVSKAENMLSEAEADGVVLRNINFNDDVNDYVTKLVIPVCDKIASGKKKQILILMTFRRYAKKFYLFIKNKSKSLISPFFFFHRRTSEKIDMLSREIFSLSEKIDGMHAQNKSTVTDFWESQSLAWERSWNLLESIKAAQDQKLSEFWTSQSAAWERLWEVLEQQSRQKEKTFEDFWVSQSSAWDKLWSDLEAFQLKSSVHSKSSVSIPVGSVEQYEYYLRANEKDVKTKLDIFKKGFDTKDIIEIDKYFSLFQLLPKNIKDGDKLVLPLLSNVFSDEDRILLSNYDLIMDRIRGDYDYLDMSLIPLSLNVHYYECGLKLLPDRISEYFTNKICIDCGAWVGDTALMFARYGFSKIYCYEPIPETFETLTESIRMNSFEDVIIPKNLAVGCENTSLRMKSVGEGGEGALITQADDADIIVGCVTLDEEFEESTSDIGLIKIDVEGFEMDVLKGAERIIKKYKPVLLISAYHTWISPEQIFEIKDFIDSLNLNYNFKFKGMQPEKGLIYEYGIICY